MELTFINDLGQTFTIDIDPGMELENVMALLEAEARLFFPRPFPG
jgi:DNA damage-inducible protein 1